MSVRPSLRTADFGMPSLFVIQGRDQGKRFELDRPLLTIGRDASCTIQLNDTEVSRKHNEVKLQHDTFQVVDLRSSNGTFINGKRADSAPLVNGDRVQVGRTLMIFTGSQSPSELANHVEVVTNSPAESQIISSLSQETASFNGANPQHDEDEDQWLERARSNLQVMYHTALAVSHTMDIDQLLGKIMGLIFEWVQADRGCVFLESPETGDLEVKVRRDRRGVGDRGVSDDRMAISKTILDYVQQNQEGVLTSDAREDQRFDAAGSIITTGIREAICVPMQGRYGNVGLIYIDTFTSPGRALQTNRANQFNDEHLKLMVAIGHQAALAIEDTSYYSAMVQAERLAAIGQTIAGLSHHVKNILQGVRGGSYLIEEGLKENDQDIVTRGWRMVEKNQEKISTLVLDMLTFSKDRQPEMVLSDLNSIVGDVLELVAVRAQEADVELVDERSAKIPELVFDGEGLHRAILNVVSNAIDACRDTERAVVRVSTNHDRQAKKLSVVVSDTGPGIPEDARQRIFGLFESEKGNRGTGLGLPVSQKILREHDGDINVVSEVGMGSIFTLHWPASKQQRATTGHETGVIGLEDGGR